MHRQASADNRSRVARIEASPRREQGANHPQRFFASRK
jgi:hypothetical protein